MKSGFLIKFCWILWLFGGMSSAGSQIIKPDFMVNDNQDSSDQMSPSLDGDGQGNYGIVWCDARPDTARIFGQLYDSTGGKIGGNFRIYEDTSQIVQYNQKMAMNNSGDFVVVWLEKLDLSTDLFGRLFYADASPKGDKIKVNDGSKGHQYFPEVAMNSAGEFIVVWNDSRNSNQEIFAQRFAADGSPEGSNFQVFDHSDSWNQNYPDVAIDDSGRFVITSDNAWSHIIAQRYNENGERAGAVFRVDDAKDPNFFLAPAIGIDRAGNFIIAWLDNRDEVSTNIYAQRFLQDATPLGSNMKVAENIVADWEQGPSVSINENGNFIITWVNLQSIESDIFARLYLADGSPYGNNFLIPTDPRKNQKSPDVRLSGHLIYSCWTDNRNDSTGYDIWSNIREWENPNAINDSPFPTRVQRFSLFQNYPNPFNPLTQIRFRLAHSARVTLEIYDAAGQKIITLLDRYSSAGEHAAVFDASGLASGIYFCTLKSEHHIQSKKMLLLR
ncbi:MAG: T9SS type A sorting domain-containing protein [Calditrichia bacterium]